MRFPWSPLPEPPDPGTLTLRRILLASEGRTFPTSAVDFTLRIARPGQVPVRVFSIARIWGTSLGFPNPGLLPSRRDWDTQRTLVEEVVGRLRHHGLEAEGHVIGTRNATKGILTEARRHQCDAIVMAADPQRHWLAADFIWSQEPYRVRRRSALPVYLIPIP